MKIPPKVTVTWKIADVPASTINTLFPDAQYVIPGKEMPDGTTTLPIPVYAGEDVCQYCDSKMGVDGFCTEGCQGMLP